MAGLEVLDIINEPTAAALAYGFQCTQRDGRAVASPGPPQRVLVYDLGGGTFDVTLLEIDGRRFRALATDGDVQLGGKDFDERLFNYLAEQFLEAHGVDPRSDPYDAAQLWRDAQAVKHALSERTRTTAVCSHAGLRLRVEVSRELFQELTRHLLERTQATTKLVIREAGIGWDQVDRVLLVGGSTRMPAVVDMLRQLTGKDPDRSVSADEAVAHGAALYAGNLMPEGVSQTTGRFELVNVNSHSLGVVGRHKATGRKVNVILIPRNTTLPHRASRRFPTARPNQTSVKVAIVEGESTEPEYCIALGQCVVRDLPPNLPQGTAVEVEYQYEANGRISVTARVPRARQSARVEIQREVSRELEDLETWRRRLCKPQTAAGPSPAIPSPSDLAAPPPDGEALLRQLDQWYTRAGTAALRATIPPKLERNRQAALAAALELQQADAALSQCQGAPPPVGPHEATLQAAALARATSAVEQARARYRFACLVLGRELLQLGYTPPELEPYRDEIQSLLRHLAASGVEPPRSAQAAGEMNAYSRRMAASHVLPTDTPRSRDGPSRSQEQQPQGAKEPNQPPLPT